MSHSDFLLPGLSANPNGLASLIVTLAFAYSRRWNRRRLEHHTYAFWDRVLSYLIYDLEPYLFHIPQLAIHNPPIQHPDLSIRTDPGANGDEYLPDFSVMGVSALNRFVTSNSQKPCFPALENWDKLKITSAKPFLIAELKRTAPRSAKNVLHFREKLETLMRLAIEDVEDQARLAFGVTLYKELNAIILIAACGEWWRFRVATRDGMKSEDTFNLLESPDEEDSNFDVDENDMVSYNKHSSESRGETKKVPGHRVSALQRYTDLGPGGDMDVLKGDVENAMPEIDEWSGNICFGTGASNQRLFLIHRWLKKERGEVGLPYADSEVRLPEDLHYSHSSIPFINRKAVM